MFTYLWFQEVPMESHPSKLVGSRGSSNRYFDFDKLAEVCILLVSSTLYGPFMPCLVIVHGN